jgi:hypothetical protein
MSTGDSVTAGKITTAYNTTDLVAETKWSNYTPTEFSGRVILRVGPSNNFADNRVPNGPLDGVQGLGNLGGTGVVGFGGPFFDAEATGIGVLGVGGQPAAGEIAPSTGGVGVRGIAGGVADGVAGTTDAHFKSGVFGFNSLALNVPNVTGFGVFGRCDTAGGAGLGGESAFGNGARAHSAENDGVVGLSDALSKSGVYGFNSREDGAAYGVFGRCAANDGAGVGADSTLGVGVHGQSEFNNAVVGLSEGGTKSGVLGVNSFASGPAFGVSGRADSAHSVGVAGASERGYGASFRGGLAPLRMEPSASAGSPTTGAHQVGEFFVDSAGDLFFCKVGGVGPAAKWVKLA